ncbi:MAG: hypothetical protein V1820_03305 [archaeon]
MAGLKIRVRGDFDLGKNLRNRPFLFEIGGGMSRILEVSGGRALCRISQKGKSVSVEGAPSGIAGEVKTLVSRCLGINDDLSEFYELADRDQVLSGFSGEIRGLRLFSAPTNWEALFCIILSQMTGFDQYKKMVYSVYSAYGGRFPSQRDVLRAPSKLDSCGVGYRKKFILGCAERFSGSLTKGLPGVGKYSESIYSLFALRDFSSVYDDVLIRRILRENYGGLSLENFEKRWGGFAGIAEVCLQKFLADTRGSPPAPHPDR